MRTFKIILHSIFIITVITAGCSRKDKVSNSVKIQKSIDQQVLLAKQYLSTGSKSQAISLLENLEMKYPKVIKVIEELGFAYKENGDAIKAAIYFEKLLNLSISAHEYRIFAAQSYIEGKSYDDACRNYKNYLEIFPNDRSTWKLLGKAYELDKNDVLALEAYLKAEELAIAAPSEKDVLKIAQLYQKVKKLEEAKFRYNAVLKRNPQSIEARVRLLKIEIQSENWSEVQKHLVKLETMPAQKVDPSFIASVKDVLIKKPKRENIASKVKTKEQKSARDWHELFILSMKNKDLINAELAAQEAVKIEPNNISYIFDYLKVIKAKGSDQILLEELKKAKMRFSNNADITLALAQTQYKIDGNLQNAKTSYEEFLQQAPNHTKSEQVKKILASL